MMYDDNDIDVLLPENSEKRKRHKDLLEQLREVEDDPFEINIEEKPKTEPDSFLVSSILKDKPKKKKKIDKILDDDYDGWTSTLSAMEIKPKKRKGSDIFDFGNGKKKKKKKKKKGGPTDYAKEFETEIALYRNLLMDQNKFTDSLQKEYDFLKSTKSSARGVNKTMTDLVMNITSARSLAMQLVEKNVNAKKLIAELTLKEKKGLGQADVDNNMSEFAANYLKQMISERQNLNTASSADIVDFTNEDDLFDTLIENLGDDNRSEDVEKYLKYENRNVTVYAYVNSEDTEDYDYVAKDENGNVIDDYPLPGLNSISINRSTNIATDVYGKKYPIIWK